MSKFIQSFITAARGAIGTPFHHQGRCIGEGLDCIGLVVVSLRAIGFPVVDAVDYERRPDGVSLRKALETHGALEVSDIMAGDILLFRYDQRPQHVAIATSSTHLIHAFAVARQVVETNIGPYWKRRLVGVYRFSFDHECVEA